MFVLVDGWNFFASCTRLFDPSLAGRPLVIAGSNDGCVIARSDEARALGIKIGQPLFEVRRDFRNSGVVTRSANFNLFGMLSSRMMTIAAELGTSWHDYSIDEGFAGMDGVPGNLVQRGRDKREKIEQWLGLPTGIGSAGLERWPSLPITWPSLLSESPAAIPPTWRRSVTW